ncbi:MAG: nickel pincer cofactor biosynthesis protein LarC, partial [Clostridia bacterium]|nr:nickel pincer cofactor biosynthesis protein LarC [Clostridia bacterium]
CGVSGIHLRVKINGEEEGGHHGAEHHHHRTRGEIADIISSLAVPDKVKSDVSAVYDIIANAESRVHGVPVDEIHFHEVGALDAVADITAVCALIEKLAPARIIASPVNTGSGTVRCAHGILPVPAPATAVILEGIPVFSNGINSELCTPTGAALLRHFASAFSPLPAAVIRKTGYGMGKKDFETANCVRAILGEADGKAEEIIELSCNTDDMTGEEIAFASERCFEAGALDVYTVPAGMKKGRPGIIFCVMCRPEDREKLLKTVFAHTSTIGIRESSFRRYTLDREIAETDTPYGKIRTKISRGFGVTKEKPEYDDISKAAKSAGKTVAEIKKELLKK